MQKNEPNLSPYPDLFINLWGNKPNLKNAEMNLNFYPIKNYNQKPLFPGQKTNPTCPHV